MVTWPDGHETKGIDRHIEDLKALFVFPPDITIKVHPIRFGSGTWTAVTDVITGTFTKPMPTPDGRSIDRARPVAQGVADFALRIEDECTVLEPDRAGAPFILHGVGRKTLARHHLKHDPPSPLELENAIATIEDEIARVLALPPQGSCLRTNDALLSEIAFAAGVRPGEPMALQAVEHSF